MTTIQTTLHYYRFDTSDEAQAQAYKDLLENTLKEIGFPVWKTDCHTYIPNPNRDSFLATVKSTNGKVIELETDHLFPNQWNAKDPSLRLFNWAEYRWPNRSLKEGYWLEQTDEMRAVLENTAKCGYCGHIEPVGQHKFCPKCIGSLYLNEGSLHLTRMVPVKDTDKNREPLTEQERAERLPLMQSAQTVTLTEVQAKHRERQYKRVNDQYYKSIGLATIKQQDSLWMLDRGINIDEAIYYDHVSRWEFGWRSPIEVTVAQTLKEKLKGLDSNWRIRVADGTDITNE